MDNTYLVTDICDKLSVSLSLLMKDNYFPDCNSLREVYDKYLHPSAIDLKDEKIWNALKEGSVQDVFQFNTDIGIQTAKAIAPTSPAEMTSANALMRLVAPEGEERPFDRYVRFKKDISLWYKEMDEFGLTREEQKILEPYYKRDYGVPASQEQLMLLVMDKDISHFTLSESNTTRKILAKKKVKEIPVIQEKFLSQCPSKKLGEYCWKTMMKPQMSYSFSEVHSLLYSFIGIQTLVVATHFPSVYWNCACLIVNSQSIEDTEDELSCYEESKEDCIEELESETNEEDEDEDSSGKKEKKKAKVADYGRIAIAIGRMKQTGIEVSPPNVNFSGFTFSPDAKANEIRFGLRGVVRLNEDLVKSIIQNRPYTSIPDFLSKVKINKPQMINLIKAGAFDEFGDSPTLMREYVNLISDTKKRITLQNMKMLIDFGLIPDEYNLERRIFNYNKYLKKMKIGTEYYGLDNIAMKFFEKNFDVDLLEPGDTESGFMISQSVWDKLYKKDQDIIRPYIKEHADELLEKVNAQLTKEVWDKYCEGSVSKWEMDSVSCYFHPHELQNVDLAKNGFSDFRSLPESPEIDRILMIKGKKVPLFKISRICGTVLDRDKMKKTVSLLTTSGVVNVKIFGEVFSYYDRQISERGADGKKHVIEKSIFSRGNKIVVSGIRRDDSFLAKKYKSTPFSLVEVITNVDENGIVESRRRIEQ